VSTNYDREAAQQRRLRDAEQRAEGQARQLDIACRLLGILAHIAAAKTGLSATEILRYAETVDETERRWAAWTPAKLEELLRDTDPERIPRKVAA
jgi:ABC-type transport system involved in cytochrome c biogenesis ATPase subunit